MVPQVIKVPSPLGLRPSGLEDAPDALRSSGCISTARVVPDLPAPPPPPWAHLGEATGLGQALRAAGLATAVLLLRLPSCGK
jgi:hypothetical protein